MPELKILRGTEFIVENMHGAFYYEFSRPGSYPLYDSISANILIPKQIKQDGNDGSWKTAYVSLGVSGPVAGSGIDIGLKSDGQGWIAGYYDGRANRADWFSDLTAPSNATNAHITIKVESKTSIKLTVEYVNSSGITVLGPKTKSISATSTSWTRFYRFASLLDNYNNPMNEGQYMKNGAFFALRMFHSSTGKSTAWGLTACDANASSEYAITDAWIKNYPKANVFNSNTDSESFEIDYS